MVSDILVFYRKFGIHLFRYDALSPWAKLLSGLGQCPPPQFLKFIMKWLDLAAKIFYNHVASSFQERLERSFGILASPAEKAIM